MFWLAHPRFTEIYKTESVEFVKVFFKRNPKGSIETNEKDDDVSDEKEIKWHP